MRMVRRSWKAAVVTIASLVACAHGGPAPSNAATAPIRFSAVYLDLDGTALGLDGQPRPATVAALADFRRCGGRVGIATGRNLDAAEPVMGLLQQNLPLALLNGALTLDRESK